MAASGGLDQRYIKSGALDPQKMNPSTGGRFTYTTFRTLGSFTAAIGYGAPTGATGNINNWDMPIDIGGPTLAQYHIKGAGQTILAPVFDVTTSLGISTAFDQTTTEGVEYIFGAIDGSATTGLKGKHAYVIGTDKPFFMRLKLSITDVSGTDQLMMGFRRTQAFQAAYTSYTDYATIGIFAAASPALIQTKTRLNTGTAVTVDSLTTWADAATKTFEVHVLQSGAVRFVSNGVLLGTGSSRGQAFTFDAGDTVIPFFYFLNSADLTDAIYLQEFSCGYEEKRLW